MMTLSSAKQSSYEDVLKRITPFFEKMQGHAVGQVYVVRGLPTFRTPHFSLLHALAASLLSKDMRIII